MASGLLEWLRTQAPGLEGETPEQRLIRVIVWSGLTLLFIGIVLAIMDLALSVEANSAMADFLRGPLDQAQTIARTWHDHGITVVPWLHLLIDLLVFLPACLAGSVALAVYLGHELRLDGSFKPLQLTAALTVLAALLLAVADLIENVTGLLVLSGIGTESLAWATGMASAWKWRLGGAVGGLLLVLLAFWYFNTISRMETPEAAQRSESRSRLRFAVADIVWRSRYTLAMLAMFAGLTLAMDQSRDVLVGLAQQFEAGNWVGGSAASAMTLLAIFTYSYASWIWPRLMLRARREQGRPQEPMLPGQLAADAAAALPADRWPGGVYVFARWWGRLLGTMPLFIVVALCGLAIRDATRIQADWTLLIVFAGVLLAVAAARLIFNYVRQPRDLEAYYDDPQGYQGGFFEEIKAARYRFFGLHRAPILVPLLALVAILVLRAIALYRNTPGGEFAPAPLALAIMALALTVWTSALNCIAQFALRKLVPWVLFLIILIGALGYSGWTNNHLVWTASEGAPTAGQATGRLWGMYLAWAAMTLVLCAGLLLIFWRNWRRGGLAFIFAGILVVLYLADSQLPRAEAQRHAGTAGRNSPDQALASWLHRVCVSIPACHAGAATSGHPVYFVSAEGGGVRAAYWTALVLARLSREPGFVERTFSLSGVSGGAVGEAVWLACMRRARTAGSSLDECIEGLGKSDLLTPLLSAWLLEDVFARIVPTSWCGTPGCGFLDRGTWFEASMEQAVIELGTPIFSKEEQDRFPVPHLFLNSTWVETGARAVASDLVVGWRSFPTARDQIEDLGGIPSLSTAAHNSARFPYVNALGAVRKWECDAGGCRKGEVAGHLVDGGVFDNSGANTTADVLRVFARCLLGHPKAPGCSEPPAVADALSREQWDRELKWLRENLVPQVIMIRNGILDRKVPEEREAREQDCTLYGLGIATSNPALDRDSGRWLLFSDVAGPAVAAFNAGGTGASGQLAEAHLECEVAGVRRALRPVDGLLPADRALRPLARFDLLEEKTLYPLGWYLSERARDGMTVQRGKQDYLQIAHSP